MSDGKPGFIVLSLKTIVAHTITYFLMGLLVFNPLDYAERFARPEMACWMRSINDPLLMAGPLFQPIRGLIFALVFYPLWGTLFRNKNGWLLMWWILVALGILSTFGPAPGSIEGMIYTRIPIGEQLIGWIEVMPQALLLSLCLCYWVNHPENKWLTRVLVVAFSLTLLFPLLGLIAR